MQSSFSLQDHFLQLIDLETLTPQALMKTYIDTLTRVFPGAVIEESRDRHLITYELHLRSPITEEELNHKHRSLKAQLGPRLIMTEGEDDTVYVYVRGIPAVTAIL